MGYTSKWAHRHTELEILRAIKKLGAASAEEIGKILDIDKRWVQRKTIMLKAAGRIYISDWKRKYTQGPPREVYSLRLEAEENAVRPKPKTGTQKTQDYRNRIYQRRMQDAISGTKHEESSCNLS